VREAIMLRFDARNAMLEQGERERVEFEREHGEGATPGMVEAREKLAAMMAAREAG
jgi:hypothetical protein